MKIPFLLVAVAGFLPNFAPAFGAPDSQPKAPAKTSVKAKIVADPLEIPGFAPIPNEFVFAGTRKDVYKLLERYTGGVSLDKLPEPTEAERKEVMEKKGAEGSETLQALLDVKHVLAPLHVVRVRSVSYRALDEAAQDEAYKKLAPKTDKDDPTDFNFSIRNNGWKRSKELLRDAETFYKNLMVKQGGKVQMLKGGETSITVYAFSQPRTFAVVTRGPSRVIVARADGKPDVGAITGIFQKVVGSN